MLKFSPKIHWQTRKMSFFLTHRLLHIRTAFVDLPFGDGPFYWEKYWEEYYRRFTVNTTPDHTDRDRAFAWTALTPNVHENVARCIHQWFASHTYCKATHLLITSRLLRICRTNLNEFTRPSQSDLIRYSPSIHV